MKKIGIAVIMPFLMSGCWFYSFSPSGKAAFKSIHVTQFSNRTIEYQMADELTDAVVAAFLADNTVQVLEADRAEAVMSGTVVNYRRDPHTFDQQDNVTAYAVKVSVSVKVVKSGTEDIIWEENFYAEGIYDAATETEETEGQERAVGRLAADILDKTAKSW